MNTTILQIPIDKNLKDEATVAARNMGFSSLQETIRVFLKKLAKGVVDVSFTEPTVLSAKAVRRYDKIMEDIKSGKEVLYEAKNAEDLLDYLYDRKDPIHAKVPKKL